MNRELVTAKIITAKVKKGLKWGDIATTIGESKEWVTAACLGQMTFTKVQAEAAGKWLGYKLCLTKDLFLQLFQPIH